MRRFTRFFNVLNAAFRIVRVAGESMEPKYRSGDYLLVWTLKRLFKPKAGDAILFKHARHGLMVKLVESRGADGRYAVRGLHPRSSETRTLGLIQEEDVIGKVGMHFKGKR